MIPIGEVNEAAMNMYPAPHYFPYDHTDTLLLPMYTKGFFRMYTKCDDR